MHRERAPGAARGAPLGARALRPLPLFLALALIGASPPAGGTPQDPEPPRGDAAPLEPAQDPAPAVEPPAPDAEQAEPTVEPAPGAAQPAEPDPPAQPEGAGEAAPRDTRSSRADYTIHARLLRMEREGGGVMLTRWRLEGRESITWTNHSGEPVSDLWFHLYLNAFSNNRSTHLLEAGERLRGQSMRDVNEEWWWGWSTVDAVAVDGVDVMPSFRFRAPDLSEERAADTVREQDRTVFSVDLPAPVPPGESVTVELEWRSQLPRVRRRTGTKGDFMLVAQWFPKLGVYEGGRGWNCHQFHANTEFYSDYGTYEVTLDLPKEFSDKVGASGVRTQNLVKGRDRVEVVFEAPSRADRERVDATGGLPLVHDFTWTADPRFVVYSDTFHFGEWARRFPEEVAAAQAALGEAKDLTLRDVAVTVLIHPERESQAERHFKATCAALFFYGLWWGEYPYEHITVVDPAWGARAAGGMEYPTLFTCGTRLFTTPETYTPESVTVHEAGHQFWYGLVGNNEFEAAWMDEGFNSYTDSEVLWRVYGPDVATTDYLRVPLYGVRPSSPPGGGALADIALAREWSLGFLRPIPFLDRASGVKLRPVRSSGLVDWWRDQPLLTLVPRRDDPRWSDRGGYLRDPDSDPVDTWAFQYVDGGSYRTNSYPRTAAKLRTLAGIVGRDAFLRGMRHYSETWRYRHPYPEDFFEAFVEGSGVDVRWYLDDAFRSHRTIDWSVDVEQRVAPEEVGYFPREDGKLEERDPTTKKDVEPPEVVLDAPEHAELEDPVVTPEDAAPERVRVVEVTLRRSGDMCIPLPWRVTIEHVPEGDEEQLPDEVRDLVWSRADQLAQAWWRERFELPRDQRVKSVVLDPDRVLYVDSDMTDNQWFAERDRVAPLRWMECTFQQYQHVLHWFAGLGG